MKGKKMNKTETMKEGLRQLSAEIEKRFGYCDLCGKSVHVAFLCKASETVRGEVLNVCTDCKGSDAWKVI
jgi:RNA polymerase-binding transcription factor DksA